MGLHAIAYKQYRYFRKEPFLGLHGISTEWFFLKNLYCLECRAIINV